ncbi:hypothetical protein EJ05DRAFT_506004 [Pseudovirgaria hyperparasitica]|uniref:Ankyrin n=1 Tax=Pseudovirgaria hyperparasitica TaxID=470096 RepID=A0A6A6VPC6_9PEZI|nr:uncharacterized protein EJ05DRAFT_506004 [Pseudovirgaria hyperparasitica]KAF2752478.1 hypothetical protein EJ05DRAFT_506004 [Pseudovirgaria hyperparasitica]
MATWRASGHSQNLYNVSDLSFSSFRSGSSADDARFEARQNRYLFLDYAAKHCGSHVAEVEEKITDKPQDYIRMSLLIAASHGQFEVVQWLLDKGSCDTDSEQTR